MKKLSRILVLVLAVALICTGLVLAVSADGGTDNTASYVAGGEAATADLAAAIAAADADSTVKLEGDCTLSTQVTISKNITIDLNGYTLNLPIQNAFAVNTASIIFTITGNGTINADGTFIYSTAAATVNVKGTGKGIKINHSGSVFASKQNYDQNIGLIIYDKNVGGTYNLENLDIVSEALVYTRTDKTEGNDNNQRAAMFRGDEGKSARWNFNRVSFYRDVTYDVGLQDAGAFVYIAGANAKATINECVIKNSGPLVNIAYMQANTNPDHVFCEVNDSHMEVVLRDGSRRVNALTSIYRGSERAVVGTMKINNSWFGGNVYRLFYGIVEGLKVNASGSVIANTGANDIDGTNDADVLVMRAGQMTLTNGSTISTGKGTLVMNGSYDVDGDKTKDTQYGTLTVEVGARFNAEHVGTNSAIKWVDADGNAVNSSDVRIVLDPIGNYQYPYLSTTEASFVSYNHLGATKIEMYAMEFGAGKGTGNIYGWNAEKDANIASLISFYEAFQGSAKAGAFTDVTYGTNTVFKYWVSPIDGVEIGEARTFTTDPYMVFGGVHDVNKAIAKIADTKVAVFEMDIATDSEYGFPYASLQINARDDGNTGRNNGSFVTLNSDGTFTPMDPIKDFNSNVKLSLTEWNHLTAVVYTDSTYNDCYGQTFIYVNGELLGYVDGAYGAAATYIQGLRFNVQKTTHIVGQSMLVDNMIRRVYSGYTDGEAEGAAKNPGAYLLTDLPKNTSPLNNNIQVHGIGYATVEDAKAARDEYNATSGTTGITEFIELKGNVIIDASVKQNIEIYHNGYSLPVTDDSYGFINDGEKYIFDEDYWFNAYWYNGTLGDEAAMADDANYIKEVVKLGFELDHANLFTEGTPDYNLLQIVTQDGWSEQKDATEKKTAFVPTLADYEAALADGSRAIRYYPVITGVDMTYYVKNSAGEAYDGGLTNADATASIKSLADGDTFILRTDIALTESNLLFASTADAPKVLNIDLAGNTLARTVSGVLMQVGAYTTLNVYSSAAGGKVVATLANATGTISDGGTCFVISDGQNNSAYIDASQLVGTRGEVTEAYINVGKFGDIPGSNMTVVAERAYYGFKGGENCRITVDGVTTIAPGSSTTSVEAYVYDGDIFVKNGILLVPEKDNVVNLASFSLAGNGVSACKNAGPRKEGFEDFIITSYVEFENMIIINKLSGLSNGANNNIVSNNGDSSNLVEGGTDHVALKFKNVVTTGRFNPSNEGGRTRVEGFVAAETHSFTNTDYAVPGTKNGIYNNGMTWDLISSLGITDEVLSFNIPAYSATETGLVNVFSYNIANNGTSISGLEDAYNLPILDKANAYEEDMVYVNWKKLDNSGNAKSEAYVKGGKYISLAADKIPSAGTVDLNAIKMVAGEWTNVPAAGTVMNENIDVTCPYTIEANVTGIKANLSLYSDFMINVYIPASYAPYVTVNGAALTGETVTLGDIQYYRLTERRVAKEAANDATFEINITEGEYTATKTVSVSISDYASVILAGEYSNADKILMYYMLSYIKEAAVYFGTEAADAEALLNNEAYAAFGNQEISHEYANALDDTGLGTYFTAAGVVLEDAPAFVLVPAGNFAGTVTATYGDGNVREYEVEAGSETAIKIEGMKIYNFGTNVRITVTDANGEVLANGTVNLDTYADYHTYNAEYGTDDSAFESYDALALIEALYDYVKVAEAYKAETLVS